MGGSGEIGPHRRICRPLTLYRPAAEGGIRMVPADPLLEEQPMKFAPLIGAAALAITVAACGSNSSTTTATTVTTGATASGSSAAPSSSTSAGAPDPNATEVVAPGDIPDNQAFVAYALASGGYAVKVPEGWSRTETNGVVTFTDKYNSIRLESSTGTSAPTVDSVRATEVPTLSSSITGFEIGDVTAVTRPAGDGVLVTYKANSAPNPVTGKSALLDVERYEFWHNGTKAILTLSGAQGADNVDPWKTVTDSVVWQ
jgi:hypothetical protein